MSKLSRTKGYSFERYVAQVMRLAGFKDAKRQLEYQIDTAQGIDLEHTGPFKIQCKKTKKYVSMNTIKEVKLKGPDDIPVLIAAGDGQEPLVTIPLWAFIWLASLTRCYGLNTHYEDGLQATKKNIKELKR